VVEETTEDAYALGDVHGDYERLVNLLAAARVISSRDFMPLRTSDQIGTLLEDAGGGNGSPAEGRRGTAHPALWRCLFVY